MRKLLKTILATALSILLLSANTVTSFATDTITDSPSEVSVPVTATVDSYYIVTIPSSTGLTMTRANLTTLGSVVGDTNSTFYDILFVGVKGNLASNTKVGCAVKCDDMTTGDTSPSTAPLYVIKNNNGLTQWFIDYSAEHDGNPPAPQVLSDKILEVVGRKLTASDFTVGTTGVSTEYTSLNADTYSFQSFTLRTTLPKDGTYTSSVELEFGLTTAVPAG